MDDQPTQPATTGIEHLMEPVRQLFVNAGVANVFGATRHENGAAVIPAAEIYAAGGFGGGSGSDQNADKVDTGSGGGGGGMSMARPVAAIIVRPDGRVDVEPIVDVTKIALALFSAIGFMLLQARKMREAEYEQ